jgi:hypothetical protein
MLYSRRACRQRRLDGNRLECRGRGRGRRRRQCVMLLLDGIKQQRARACGSISFCNYFYSLFI